MALQGPFAVIADSPAPDVVEALRAAGAFPIIEATWTDAPTALGLDRAGSGGSGRRLRRSRARCGAGAGAGRSSARRAAASTCRSSPAPATTAGRRCPTRWRSPPVRRPSVWCGGLSTALRIRTLHGTVLRRMRTLASRGEHIARTADGRSARRSDRAGRRAAAAPIRRSRSRSANASAWSARSASRARRARSMPATSTAW